MHPVENIRGSASAHLSGRRIVLAVSGSIAAVKTVELARELIRHGAEVHAVMSKAAEGIVTADAVAFGTGNPVITRLTGAVEHVALMGDVPGRADLLLVAPATANTVGKMAYGIDDTPVTTFATVAFGNGVPVVVAPAMHDAMIRNPPVQKNIQALVEEMGVTWVEPKTEEKKAKLADVEAIVEAVIHRLAQDDGPLAGKRCLVVGGATAEAVDPVRILTNRSSGRSAILLARELRRLGADVILWLGHATVPVPSDLEPFTQRFSSHEDLLEWSGMRGDAAIDQVWMPAAIGDYGPAPEAGKIPSGQDEITLTLHPLEKIIKRMRDAAPEAVLVAFKAESDADALEERARKRLAEYDADWIVANTSEAFGADDTRVHLLGADGSKESFEGSKAAVLGDVARRVAEAGTDRKVTVDR